MGNENSVSQNSESLKETLNWNDSLQNLIPKKHRIDRVSKISPQDFYNNYYLKQKPVIITDMATEWPAIQKWNIDYLRKQVGHYKHTFHYEDSKTIEMKVSDYLDLAEKYIKQTKEDEKKEIDPLEIGFPKLPSKFEKLPYIRHFGPLPNKSKELSEDVNTLCMFPLDCGIKGMNYMFVGLPKTKTEIHYDGTHNFVSIIRGQKHITLLPPGKHEKMFEGISEDQSKVWIKKTVLPLEDPPNLCLDLSSLAKRLEKEGNLNSEEIKIPEDVIMMHQHPVLKNADELYYSPIHESEIVFFPAYWFHYLHNCDLSVSVTTQTFGSKDFFN